MTKIDRRTALKGSVAFALAGMPAVALAAKAEPRPDVSTSRRSLRVGLKDHYGEGTYIADEQTALFDVRCDLDAMKITVELAEPVEFRIDRVGWIGGMTVYFPISNNPADDIEIFCYMGNSARMPPDSRIIFYPEVAS